jgi:hypothetical protein
MPWPWWPAAAVAHRFVVREAAAGHVSAWTLSSCRGNDIHRPAARTPLSFAIGRVETSDETEAAAAYYLIGAKTKTSSFQANCKVCSLLAARCCSFAFCRVRSIEAAAGRARMYILPDAPGTGQH